MDNQKTGREEFKKYEPLVNKTIAVIQQGKLSSNLTDEKITNQIAADVLSVIAEEDIILSEIGHVLGLIRGVFDAIVNTCDRTIAQNYNDRAAENFGVEKHADIPIKKILKL